jgi:heme exporter protein C
MKISRFSWLLALLSVLWVSGLALALVFSPADTTQGECMRILYVHCPASWLSLLILTAMAILSAVFLIMGNPKADLWAEACAPVGALMTVFSLITGSLWGKPIWGTYWIWDARLTSMALLFFLYGGILGVRAALVSPLGAGKSVAVLTLFAWLNVPLIKGAVVWFHTLHQPASIVRFQGPTLPGPMMMTLIVMTGAMGGTAALLIWLRSRILKLKARQRSEGVREMRTVSITDGRG